MNIQEAFGIVLSLARENALDPELHCDSADEVKLQEEAFIAVCDFLEAHGINGYEP